MCSIWLDLGFAIAIIGNDRVFPINTEFYDYQAKENISERIFRINLIFILYLVTFSFN